MMTTDTPKQAAPLVMQSSLSFLFEHENDSICAYIPVPTHGCQPNNGLLFLCYFHYVTNITQLKYDELQYSKLVSVQTRNICGTTDGM